MRSVSWKVWVEERFRCFRLSVSNFFCVERVLPNCSAEQNMDYIRPKLQINRYKNRPPHILFQKIAHEIQCELQTKLNFALDYDLSLWLIRLMSLNTKYRIGCDLLFDRVAVDALIKDYLQIVSGNLTFCWMEKNSHQLFCFLDEFNDFIFMFSLSLSLSVSLPGFCFIQFGL